MACSRRVGVVLGAALLASCSGPIVPPEDVDGNISVNSIETTADRDNSYAAPQEPVQSVEDSVDYLDRPNLAGVDDQQLPKIDEVPAETANQVPDNGVNIDDGLGVPPVGLAEEQARDIAEGDTAQPLVDGIGTDNPVERPRKVQIENQQFTLDAAAASDEVTPPSRRQTDKADETEVAFIPRLSDPLQVPETYGGLTAADRSCRAELKKLGVRFRELSPIADGSNCGIDHPIEVSGFSGGISLKPAAKLNCNLTRSFAKWVKYELVPSARYRYFSGIDTIRQMSSYSCRKMNSKSSNPWSEHAHGNAIDVGTFILKSGKEIDVRKKGLFAFREKGLLKAVRSDSCKYFNTVLGPGSDPHHKDHFHFDLRSRKSGYRHCD